MRKVYQYGAILLAASVIVVWQSTGFVRGAQIAPIQCDDLAPNIRDAAANCAFINGKHVCYNSDFVIGLPFTPHFTTPKDRASLRAFEEVYTEDIAGVAVLNLSEAEESWPVFGTLIGPVTAELEESEILCLRARDDIPSCEGAPPGLVASNGGKRARVVSIGPNEILVNGVAYIVPDTNGNLSVFNLAGEVRVTTDEYTVAIPEDHMIGGIDGACGDDALAVPGDPGPAAAIVFSPSPAPMNRTSPTPTNLAAPAMPSAPTPSPEQTITLDPDIVPGPKETPVPLCDGSIEIGDTVVTQNYDPGQACLLAVCGDADEIITVEMTSLDGDMDPWLELRGPDDRIMTFNDDIGPEDRNSSICNLALPMDGCYTIAARSYRYETFGRFSVAVTGGESGCTPPPARCDVISPRGLKLRAGPSLNADVIGTLPRGALLDPIAQSGNGAWVEVHTRNGERGWVNAAPTLLICSAKSPPIQVIGVATEMPSPTPTDTPTATPTDRPKKKPTPRKPGVYTVS